MNAQPKFADAAPAARPADLSRTLRKAALPRDTGWRARLSRMRGSIAGRVRIFAICITLILTLLGALVGGALAVISTRAGEASVGASRALAASQLATSIAESRYFASRYAASGEAGDIAAAFATLDEARSEIDTTIAMAGGDDASRVQMEWLVTQVEGFAPELRALQASITVHGPSPSGAALAKAIDISGGQLARQAAGIERDLQARSQTAQTLLRRLTGATLALALALIAGCVALVVYGARGLSRQVAGSLGEITGAMTALADGNRAIAIPGTEREDEIGAMARALVVFRKSAEALSALQRRAREEQAAVLRRLVDSFQGGVGEAIGSVTRSAQTLQVTATDMDGAASRTIGFVERVSSDMEDTQVGVTAAASASDQFALSIAEIGRQAGHSASMVQEARLSADEADGRIGELLAVAEEIGGVVHLIGSIADRTNLLALNASIEAARGGEAGRGFAVVAAEVKALARQTRAATGDVERRIDGMQDLTRASVAALGQIGARIREVELSATAIAQAVEEQSLSSRELARNLDRAANGVTGIGGSLLEIGAMARATGSAAGEVLDAASALQGTARDLGRQSRAFEDSVRAA